jgi:hypothetical protein
MRTPDHPGFGRTIGETCMADVRHRRTSAVLAGMLLVAGGGGAALAADPAPLAAPNIDAPLVMSPAWSFTFVPYGWLTSLDGTQTVRGRSVKVDASFIDIVEKSDTLVALMGTFVARKGPFSVYSDVVWSKVGVEGNNVRTRTPAPGISGTVGRSLGLDIEMAIVEVGASYEVARAGPLSVDLLGGVRYWYQEADVSLDIVGTVDIGDLERTGALGIARSGSVDWVDPVFGARLRYTVAPGHELFLRGDVGGFGLGSDFSWQAIGGYGFDFGAWQGITFSGIVGYRALYVDYAQGFGRTRYEFDMLQHGPVLGVSMRF